MQPAPGGRSMLGSPAAPPREMDMTDIGRRLTSRSGLSVEVTSRGAIRRFDCDNTALTLFVGNELEGGPTNVYLRRHRGGTTEFTPLLGPRSPTRFDLRQADGRLIGAGSWHGIEYVIALVLAQDAPAWFWHVRLLNTTPSQQQLDLICAHDIALAPYATVRLNEYYVSQYVDHSPLQHPARGCAVASRQNLPAEGRNPWCVIGSLRSARSFATDAIQLHGLATRAGDPPAALAKGLPSRRLQHEHSLVAIQDAMLHVDAGQSISAGFFGVYRADHPGATSPADLERIDEVTSLPEAVQGTIGFVPADVTTTATLFASAPLLQTVELDAAGIEELFPGERRHEERDEQGTLLSFFHGEDSHVVLRAKELRVLRPHGHMLRTGLHVTPDESALTSTAWMDGVFHSMVTQGHVSFNRFLSTTHSYLGLFRSHGQRMFVEIDGAWRLLDVPSAFAMSASACRWIYRHAGGTLQVRAEAHSNPHELTLAVEASPAKPVRLLISHHVALNGDDGSGAGRASWRTEGGAVIVAPAAQTDVARRFPEGSFEVAPLEGTAFERVAGDELLFADGRSREQPYICIVTAAAVSAGLRIRGHLVPKGDATARSVESAAALAPQLKMTAPAAGPLGQHVARLADIVPWFAHNAFVHYLAPRGLEQYSGGGWGTRDVSQGPVELLLALGRVEPIRDLLLRLMSAQNPDGDWPQWFMFFERDRAIRAGDSHGDIVFWPVLALAQYLIASGDASVLDERVADATVWQHAERALALIEKRVVPGTALAAYGHGDWNDALQPADPAMREHMCSAWTVTLHYQTLLTLARALRVIGRSQEATQFESQAEAVRRDFQRMLVVDGVLTGYALFEQGGVRHLLHPSDTTTGVHYSSLAMIHAILEDLLTPQQARSHLQLIDAHLRGPDGVRLFDRPMPYHGGPMRLFQRAESATFFGREIGLMYMHAHLRYAQALAHVGEADRFFHALCQANPIGISAIVPRATLRQANCYYSSSDAAFADRYEASAEYQRVAEGRIDLDGGWRVYSSGAGIALGLIVRRFLGLSPDATALSVDPVIPSALDGLRVMTTLLGRPVEVTYSVGTRGYGVSAIELNGRKLAFEREHNPYRESAARVPIKEVTDALQAKKKNRLEIGLS
jgi:1,2-beta-oligoglucan phosphorylase